MDEHFSGGQRIRGGLMDKVRTAARVRHFSPSVVTLYASSIKHFILFHGKRHPRAMGGAEIRSFLSHLTIEEGRSRDVVDRVLGALVFLYREVLLLEPPGLDLIIRERKPRLLPDLPTRDEVRRLLAVLEGRDRLVLLLLYDAGLTTLECLRLRVADLELPSSRLRIRERAPGKRSCVDLGESVIVELRHHLQVLELRQSQGEAGFRGAAFLQQYLFPADSVAGASRPIHPRTLDRLLEDGAVRAGLSMRMTPEVLRHAGVAHLLEDGHDLAELRRRLGYGP